MSNWSERVARTEARNNEERLEKETAKKAELIAKAETAFEKFKVYEILEDIRRDVWREGHIEDVDNSYRYRESGFYYDYLSRMTIIEQTYGFGTWSGRGVVLSAEVPLLKFKDKFKSEDVKKTYATSDMPGTMQESYFVTKLTCTAVGAELGIGKVSLGIFYNPEGKVHQVKYLEYEPDIVVRMAIPLIQAKIRVLVTRKGDGLEWQEWNLVDKRLPAVSSSSEDFEDLMIGIVQYAEKSGYLPAQIRESVKKESVF